MKTLIIMRHGHAESGGIFSADIKRNLDERGKSDVARMAEKFASKKELPQLIICSAANRTAETCRIFTESAGYKGDIQYFSELYHASAALLVEHILMLPDSIENVMFIGHNPGVSKTIKALLQVSFEEMPTSGLAILKLPENKWVEIGTEPAFLDAYYFPKQNQS